MLIRVFLYFISFKSPFFISDKKSEEIIRQYKNQNNSINEYYITIVTLTYSFTIIQCFLESHYIIIILITVQRLEIKLLMVKLFFISKSVILILSYLRI